MYFWILECWFWISISNSEFEILPCKKSPNSSKWTDPKNFVSFIILYKLYDLLDFINSFIKVIYTSLWGYIYICLWGFNPSSWYQFCHCGKFYMFKMQLIQINMFKMELFWECRDNPVVKASHFHLFVQVLISLVSPLLCVQMVLSL